MTGFEKRLVRATARTGRVAPFSISFPGASGIPRPSEEFLTARMKRQQLAPSGRRVMSVWLRLLEAHNLILREVRRDLGGVMTLPQFDVLAQLDGEPEGLTLADLSRRLRVTAANVTGIVGRLERGGSVLRTEDPFDGRAFRVCLTSRGRRHLRGLIPKHAEILTRLLEGLDIEDQLELQELLGRLGDGISRGRYATRAPGGPAPVRAQSGVTEKNVP